MRQVNRYLHWLDRALSYWCIFLAGSMTLLIISSVILRYLFHLTFVWAEAAITMLFIGTTYFGAVLGVREDEHIGISYFVERFPENIQRYVQSFGMLVIIIVQTFIFKTSLTWIEKVGKTVDVALKVPMSYLYIMVPISAVLIILYAIVKIISYLFPGVIEERKKKEEVCVQ